MTLRIHNRNKVKNSKLDEITKNSRKNSLKIKKQKSKQTKDTSNNASQNGQIEGCS